MNHRRLDGELAAVRKVHGLKIYPYFIDEEDGSLREDYTAGSVLLGLDAQLDLTDIICTPLGGCDKLKDAQSEIERLTSLLRDVAIPVSVGAIDIVPLPNGVTHMGMDEGEIRGTTYIAELIDKLEEFAND